MAMSLKGGRIRTWRCQECGKLVWTIEEPLSIGPLVNGQEVRFWELNTLFRLRLCRECWLARGASEGEEARVLEALVPARKVFEELARLIDDALLELELVAAPLASSEEELAELASLRQTLGLVGRLSSEAVSLIQKLAQGEVSVEEAAARWEELAPRWEQIMQALPKMEEIFAGEEIEEQQAFYLFTTAPLLWRLLTQPPELGDRLEAL
jgi:hypothetical protein